jgi:hypothetical protein
LHAHADAEERNAALNGRANGRRKAGRVQALCCLKMADAGQYDLFRILDKREIGIGDTRLRAQVAKRLEN